MRRYGTIYDGSQSCGSIYFTKQENIAYNIAVNRQLSMVPKAYHVSSAKASGFRFSLFLRNFLFVVFTGFIGLSLFGFVFLFWPVLVQEVRYKLILSQQTTASDKVFPGFPQGDQWSPANTTFSIVVPKIDAKAPIVANIDSSKEQDYLEALKKGVAHAKGTCFPGMDCTMYLFAHSAGSPIIAARYNAVFYLLGKLEQGDNLIIYYEGRKILYEVTGKEIVGATDTRYITDVGKEERLILQTCDPPGTTNNRMLVFAKPKLVEYLK